MIDLGQKYEPPCMPSASDCKEEPKVSYPTLYFTCDQKCDLPDQGTAVIKFRKVEDAENTRDKDDPKYRYELEVQGIEVRGMKDGDQPSISEKLKDGLRKKMKKGDYEDGE